MFNRITFALTQLLQKPKYILKIILHMLKVCMAELLPPLPPAYLQKLIFILSFHKHMVAWGLSFLRLFILKMVLISSQYTPQNSKTE